jgi:hypothetical protein
MGIPTYLIITPIPIIIIIIIIILVIKNWIIKTNDTKL